MNRIEAKQLLETWIENPALRHHCIMVAKAMEAYAHHLGKPTAVVEQWWLAGLLHDLDWEKYPDEHPHKAIAFFQDLGFSEEVIQAIKAHAPQRTGVHPTSELDKYLFACDELSGFMHAVSLMRPTRFDGMEPKSVLKKLKDKKFAEAVSREDIQEGAAFIKTELNEHIRFLIHVFNAMA